jgi:hypothetical protein
MKVLATGHRTVYDPDLLMYHFESSSRSAKVDSWEKAQLRQRWSHMAGVDPYSNPNLKYGLPRISSNFRWAGRRLPGLSRLRAAVTAAT